MAGFLWALLTEAMYKTEWGKGAERMGFEPVASTFAARGAN